MLDVVVVAVAAGDVVVIQRLLPRPQLAVVIFVVLAELEYQHLLLLQQTGVY